MSKSDVILPPRNVKIVVPSTEKVKISWDPVKDADEYKVYYYSAGSFNKKSFTTKNSQIELFFQDNKLEKDSPKNIIDVLPFGDTYYYVTSVKDEKESEKSNIVLGKYETIPSPMINRYSSTSKSIQISWETINDINNFLVKYESPECHDSICEKSENKKQDFCQNIEISQKTNSNFIILDNLFSGCTYNIKIYAINSFGTPSEIPAEISIATKISLPTDLKAVAGDKKVTLSWKSPPHIKSFIINYNQRSVTSSGSNIVIKGLDNGKKYVFYLRSVSELGNISEEASSVDATPTIVSPKQIQDIQITPGNKEVYLQWEKDENANHYQIMYTFDKKKWTTLTTSHNEKVIGDLENNKKYTFRISSINSNGEESKFLEFFATPILYTMRPKDVPIITYVIPGDEKISFSWNPVKNAEEYVVKGLEKSIVVRGTSVTIPDLDNEKVYKFRVAASNERGIGPDSLEISVIPSAGNPEKPTNLNIKEGDESVFAQWSPSHNSIKYYVYLGEKLPLTIENIVTETSNTSIFLKGLTNNVQYYLAVSAVNSKGVESQKSEEKSFIATVMKSTTPSESYVIPGKETIYGIWSNSENAVGYYLYIAKDRQMKSEMRKIYSDNPYISLTEGIEMNTDYYFQVSSVNAQNEESVPTAVQKFRTLAMTPPPYPPVPEVRVIERNGALDVQWNPIKDTKLYAVFVSPNPQFSAEDGKIVMTTHNRAIVTGLVDLTKYFVQVIAINGSGPSDPSVSVSAIPMISQPRMKKCRSRVGKYLLFLAVIAFMVGGYYVYRQNKMDKMDKMD